MSLERSLAAAPLAARTKQAAARLGELGGLAAAHPAAEALLVGVAAGSPYLWELCLADPARLDRLLRADPGEALDAALAVARAACEEAGTLDDAMRALRRLKQEAALLIGLADLGGVWGIAEVTGALTRTADAATSLALRWLLAEAVRAGRFLPPDPADPERGSGLVVLAMGKHGAGELNYSSDIDLIVLYDPDIAPLREGLEPNPFFVRLTQGLVRLLSERTADGYVFRVDLRLRPDPGATAVAISFAAAFGYYESVGQNWERAALIKARPCAGDKAAGAEFLRGIAPFIWRRHLDYAAIADVHAMKRQIHVHKGHGTIAVAGHDLKLGRGGIREIEFFVQTQQLIAGGRNPQLRGRETVAMLAALCEAGWITAQARDDLTEAYAFLRGLEHRLQMVADEQTHAVPADPERLERFVRFAGYRSRSAFAAALVRRLETVQHHYGRLFEAAPELAGSAGSLVFTGKDDDPETLKTLAGLGFSAPAGVAETIRGWHFGRYPAMRSARAREDLTELTPALLEALARDRRPDEALLAFDGLLSRMPSGYQLFSILRNNTRLLDTLARILAVAPRLAEIVAARPHVLDGLLDPAGAGEGTDEPALEERAHAALAVADGYEDRLDLARVFARERLFVIGARLLFGDLKPLQAAAEISALAAVMVRVLVALVRAELAAAHGELPGGAVCVLAMGKLGGRELTATSDLDLIVVYDHAPGAVESTGPRPLAPSVWFARLTQRLIAALSAPTAQGALFSVDMRLRPSGRKGPVALHVDAFGDYQRTEAWTWEHMALTRARAVAGDPALQARVGALIAEVLTTPRDAAKTLRDIGEMRRLLAEEKGEQDRWDLKQAAGGQVDVEFVAQALQLVHAPRHSAMLATNTGAALDRAAAAGVLAAGDHEVLAGAWRLYGGLTQIVRVCIGADIDLSEAPDALKSLLAESCGEPDFKVLAAAIAERQKAVRAIFRSIVG
ncbi:bifunctional [glutamine synthetase] adenylyltransferase/[glutamine synthetase]-adenylyl-L-tyrosine phosphorylase [Labrys wisconsinensis]|uniref:Bifunctional glutamine synthetase adenylyltransferase/adenylyl-removing enzyme n=1 Tax=Labrys wisconsinensis TaxID=425677 RepID=A0ABU0J8I1_9HYPH|nr:bifunctional [glutamine synthetase] adenylyltransferase/[glutamine synthetase]-adenylyl-L-tyrosine phosphorylase [Labrys wisconsinensis]MDQ0469738.1 glutamate-ammonia-ligase adenylyltransferase [Labrys wisconsinensis]